MRKDRGLRRPLSHSSYYWYVCVSDDKAGSESLINLNWCPERYISQWNSKIVCTKGVQTIVSVTSANDNKIKKNFF